MYRKLNSIILFLLSGTVSQASARTVVVEGNVQINQEAALAASLYLKHHRNYYAITDETGDFTLQFEAEEVTGDTLVVTYLGYSTQEYPMDRIQSPFHIQLQPSNHNLSEIVIQTDPVLGREFAVQKLSKSDIYMDPSASADPLKTISMRSYSTSTSESANPELRGSAAGYSTVFINGVPIDNPVRNQQMNNLGNFSLFNAEIVGNQYVYPSNPPLNLGHSIAGAVDIRTTNELTYQAQTQVSLSLAQIGLFHSRKIGNRGLIQVYTNTQHSRLYKQLNPESLDYLHHFRSTDVGLNARWHTGANSYINLYSYYVDESYRSDKGQYNYYGTMSAGNVRQFNVLNWLWKPHSWVIGINAGYDQSHSHYQFGWVQDTTDILTGFLSTTVKKTLSEHWGMSAGGEMTYYRYRYTQTLQNERGECFLNCKYSSDDDWQVGLYARGHFASDHKPRLSLSAHIRKNLGEWGEILASVGQYNSQLHPSYYIRAICQVSSTQSSIDYRYHKGLLTLDASLYAKREKTPLYLYLVDNPQLSENKILGTELSGRYQTRHLSFHLAYSFITAKVRFGGKDYHAFNDQMHLFKATLQYENARIFNLSLSYVDRPGLYYTSYGGNINASRLRSYSRLDLTVNRYFRCHNIGIVPFLSVTNILNRKNIQYYYFSPDYSQQFSQLYQRLLVYLGASFTF